MAQQHTFTDGYRPRAAELIMPDLTHLAVGDGAVSGAPVAAATALEHEIARVRYFTRYFVEQRTGGGLIFDGVEYGLSLVPTRFVYFGFRFLADEAQGNWSELGLFGADVSYVAQQAKLVAQAVTGDDQIDRDVILGGAWAPPASGELSVTVSTGGGDGVAQITWTDPGNLAGGDGGPVPVAWNAPVNLGTSGVSIRFTGGPDGILTVGDRWRVLGTLGPSRPEYAEGGVYNPDSNPGGQVLEPGILMRLSYMDPPQEKVNVFLDVAMIVEVIRP